MTTYAQDRDGKYIPASQRPDGTWRKARRVKDGYVPQEEVPLYESKGKLFMKKPALPVGMCPIVAQQAKEKRERQQLQQQQQQQKQQQSVNPIPGLFVLPNSSSNSNDSNQKKKQNAKTLNGMSNTNQSNSTSKKSTPKSKSTAINASTSSTTSVSVSAPPSALALTNHCENKLSDAVSNMKITNTDDDPAKKIKKLRKKIREIEVIENKLSKGEKIDQDQMQKVSRKTEIEKQLNDLEQSINK